MAMAYNLYILICFPNLKSVERVSLYYTVN